MLSTQEQASKSISAIHADIASALESISKTLDGGRHATIGIVDSMHQADGMLRGFSCLLDAHDHESPTEPDINVEPLQIDSLHLTPSAKAVAGILAGELKSTAPVSPSATAGDLPASPAAISTPF